MIFYYCVTNTLLRWGFGGGGGGGELLVPAFTFRCDLQLCLIDTRKENKREGKTIETVDGRKKERGEVKGEK
jgi:hypothetical protein